MTAHLRLTLLLLLCALPAVAAGFFILKIALVSSAAWWIQSGATAALLLAALGGTFLRFRLTEKQVAVVGMLGLALCALPLLHSAQGPVRWVRVGGFALYIAPVVIPVLLVFAARAAAAAGGNLAQDNGHRLARACVLVLASLAWVLAIQPDLAQSMALSLAALLIILCLSESLGLKAALALPFLLACLWAALQPDPLEPVPHVEQVIRLAWVHSPWVGLGVSGAAVLLVAGPAWLLGRRHPAWLALPAYYLMLVAGSLLDMTPAPLMGYGAGPLLGFGLMAGLGASALADARNDAQVRMSGPD